MKKIKSFAIVFLVIAAVFLLSNIIRYSVFGTPYKFLKYHLNVSDFLGEFTIWELSDGNGLYIHTITDERDKDNYKHYTVYADDLEVLVDILDDYIYTTGFIDYTAGELKHPKIHMDIPVKTVTNLHQAGRGTVSYGVTYIDIIDDYVVAVHRGIIKEEHICSYPGEGAGFCTMRNGNIPYYCKDPALIEELKNFISGLPQTAKR